MNDSKSNFEIQPIFPQLIYVSELEISEIVGDKMAKIVFAHFLGSDK